MIDTDLLLRFVAALTFVLVLIAGVAWLGRRYMSGGRIGRLAGRRRRLAVVEVLPVDGRTRLVLVRRDTVEHLIVLGAAGTAVVESGIAPQGDFAGAVDAAARQQIQASQ